MLKTGFNVAFSFMSRSQLCRTEHERGPLGSAIDSGHLCSADQVFQESTQWSLNRFLWVVDLPKICSERDVCMDIKEKKKELTKAGPVLAAVGVTGEAVAGNHSELALARKVTFSKITNAGEYEAFFAVNWDSNFETRMSFLKNMTTGRTWMYLFERWFSAGKSAVTVLPTRHLSDQFMRCQVERVKRGSVVLRCCDFS